MSNNYSQAEDLAFPVAFVAVVTNATMCELAVADIMREEEALKHAGVEHLRFFYQRIDGEEILVAMMDINAAAVSKCAREAWNFVRECKRFSDHFVSLERLLRPHRRNTGNVSSPWTQAETICEIRPENNAEIKSATWHEAVTGLKVEKEAEYRLLHQNVWPGVIKAIGASNISRFDIFLMEFGDNQPYVFYQFQYTGDNFKNDMKAQSLSPINQRWWKYTNACQLPLPAASEDSPWQDMKKL